MGIRRSPRPLRGERFMHNSGASRRGVANVCLEFHVIASEATQSVRRHSGAMPTGPRNARPDDKLRIEPGMTEAGSLRCARNDGKSTYDFALATQRARAVHLIFAQNRGRRERRVPAAPAAPCAKVESTGVEATGTPEHPAFPAQWF